MLDIEDTGAMDGTHRYIVSKPKQGCAEMTMEKIPLGKNVDRARGVLGDGQATISIGLDVKTSEDYGNAAGCTVFVKLTCGQNNEMLEAAHKLAEEIAYEYAQEGYSRAKEILDKARSGELDPPVNIPDEPQVEGCPNFRRR